MEQSSSWMRAAKRLCCIASGEDWTGRLPRENWFAMRQEISTGRRRRAAVLFAHAGRYSKLTAPANWPWAIAFFGGTMGPGMRQGGRGARGGALLGTYTS